MVKTTAGWRPNLFYVFFMYLFFSFSLFKVGKKYNKNLFTKKVSLLEQKYAANSCELLNLKVHAKLKHDLTKK